MIKILHNPRCSKSREALKILQESGEDFSIIEYLKDVPSEQELAKLYGKLGERMLRKKEEEFKSYKNQSLSIEKWGEVLHRHPRLIERPLVIKGNRALVGRPPEKVRDFLN